jgi:hypothetical protein
MIDYFDPTTNRNIRNDFVRFRRNFIMSPTQWNTILGQHLTFNWNEVKFSETNRNTLPQVEGLYLFTASPKKVNASFINYLFYVGETDNINRRFGNYLDKVDHPKSGQYRVYTIIDDFPDNLYFHYVELPGLNTIGRRVIEDQFLVAFLPPINSKFPQGLQSIISAAYGQ